MIRVTKITFASLIVIFVGLAALFANPEKPLGDWPQYRGLNRDGISLETGLIKSWPATGPKVNWRAPIGEGYSGVAAVGGKLFTMDSRGNDEFVVALDAQSGKELWRYRNDASYDNDQGNGPRSTPIVEGNMVYAVGALGQLVALSGNDGKKVWAHNLQSEFGSEIPQWGTSTSPIIEKDLLIVDVGGSAGNSIVAFHKKNGTVQWKVHTDKQGYSAPIAVNVNGTRQILIFTGTALVSVTPQGKLLWKYPWRTSYDANIAAPVFVPPDKVFISTSYDVGAALLQIKGGGVQEVWKNRVMKNHFNSSVFYENHIYGFDDATLKCIDALTGAEKWKQRGYGKGSLILADGNLIVLSDSGQLALVEATPTAYKEVSTFQALKGKCWTMPTLSNGKLYLRNQKELVSFDLKASQ
ncbi:MAG TPA: PQQ-binding-like beta-propeller repeat protein [Acidobacteriota bacterium]|nr:PQQ-binding-like beta-propeller repeat protein [Acidobacteriota bacterium]